MQNITQEQFESRSGPPCDNPRCVAICEQVEAATTTGTGKSTGGELQRGCVLQNEHGVQVIALCVDAFGVATRSANLDNFGALLECTIESANRWRVKDASKIYPEAHALARALEIELIVDQPTVPDRDVSSQRSGESRRVPVTGEG